jgi:hypothetical protein
MVRAPISERQIMCELGIRKVAVCIAEYEEWHWKIAQIKQPRVDTPALLQVLKNPLRGPFRESTLAGAPTIRK